MYTITCKVRLTKNGYNGYIVVSDNGRYSWSLSSKITRLNKIDAINDAKILKNDAILSNQL